AGRADPRTGPRTRRGLAGPPEGGAPLSAPGPMGPVSVLGRRLLAVHDGLRNHGVPHAFGGAIALAYCTEEPRGTRDLDVNVFVAPADAGPALAALPAGVVVTEDDRRRIERDGQTRL